MYPIIYPTNPYAFYMYPAIDLRSVGGGTAQQQKFYKSPQEALALIRQTVRSEREDELFYNYLISIAPTEEEETILTDIRDDELKHNRMFRTIYKDLTGQTLPAASQEATFVRPPSYVEGIKGAMFGELTAMEKYRDIRAGMPNNYYRDMVFEILTDELEHASKYNYILNVELGRKIR